MRLHKATMNDARRQFEWANEMREWAVNTEPIPWDAHVEWMESVIADPDRTLYIADIGSVRFDLLDDGMWEVSIIVDPDHRGNGHGRKLLDAGIETHGPGTYLARVKPENGRSLGLFRHWTEIEPAEGLRRFVYERSASVTRKYSNAATDWNVWDHDETSSP